MKEITHCCHQSIVHPVSKYLPKPCAPCWVSKKNGALFYLHYHEDDKLCADSTGWLETESRFAMRWRIFHIHFSSYVYVCNVFHGCGRHRLSSSKSSFNMRLQPLMPWLLIGAAVATSPTDDTNTNQAKQGNLRRSMGVSPSWICHMLLLSTDLKSTYWATMSCYYSPSGLTIGMSAYTSDPHHAPVSPENYVSNELPCDWSDKATVVSSLLKSSFLMAEISPLWKNQYWSPYPSRRPTSSSCKCSITFQSLMLPSK